MACLLRDRENDLYVKIRNVLQSFYQAGRVRVRARIVDAEEKVRYLTSLKWRAIPTQTRGAASSKISVP